MKLNCVKTDDMSMYFVHCYLNNPTDIMKTASKPRLLDSFGRYMVPGFGADIIDLFV